MSENASCQPRGFNEGLVVGINPYTKDVMRLVVTVTSGDKRCCSPKINPTYTKNILNMFP